NVPIEPNFAWIDMPYSDRYSQSVREGCDELIEALGGQVDRIAAPESFAVLIEAHKVIYDFEIYRALESERGCPDQISGTFVDNMQRAAGRSEAEYAEAMEIHTAACGWFEQFFNDYDAILTPSAPSEPPPFEQGTGDAICCVIWTLCGLPCISLPLLVGEHELPIGVQLVGGFNEDDRLFRTARWTLDFLRETEN
ncbi:MAG: amidase family protein, partial [Pseudomonadota bacterium]